MCNGTWKYNLRSSGNGYGVSWIWDLSDAQNPRKMLLIDIQCLIVHITGQLFECERLGVINTILELQLTNHNWKSCLELLQRNGNWPSVKLFNSPRGTPDLHGIYGCRSNALQRNIQWWCESKCNNKRTPLINPSRWTLVYHWCNVNS